MTVAVADISANAVPAATLLINPFTIHAASDPSVAQTIAVSNPVVSLTSTAGTTPAVAGQTTHHHQNVRDMDIVHVNQFPINHRPSLAFSSILLSLPVVDPRLLRL